MEIQAIGNRLVVRVLQNRHASNFKSSVGIALPDSELDKHIGEAVVLSVGEKCNPAIKVGSLITFEGNAIRRFQTRRLDPNWVVLFDDDVYAVITDVELPNIPELAEVNE
jgi:co-chaperonin GroES (HSP10)